MRQAVTLCCVLLLAGCARPQHAAKPTTAASPITAEAAQRNEATMTKPQLEVDLYSGRPNPKGELAEDALRSLSALLGALAATEPVTMFDGLGYRGLVVTFTGKDDGQKVTLRIYKGVIERRAGAATTYLADPERQAARLLLKATRQWLEPEPARLIAAEEQIQ